MQRGSVWLRMMAVCAPVCATLEEAMAQATAIEDAYHARYPVRAPIVHHTPKTSLRVVEADAVREALVRANHVKARAAAHLGVSRRAFYRLLKKHEITE